MRTARLPALALLLAVLAGCSLPVPRGVHPVRSVGVSRDDSGDIQVLPPGPKPGETPEEIVQHFLAAQANAADQHAVARQFLAEPAASTWKDDTGVQVYDPDSLRVLALPASPGPAGVTTVEVSATVVGQVREDGSYAARPSVPLREAYGLAQVRGEWRLVRVPVGLRLTAADRERSYRPSQVFYLAPASDVVPAHLVPDLVLLPSDTPGALDVDRLVRRLVQPPSVALGRSVSTAFPRGTEVRSVTMSGTGVVTVDLGGPLAALGPTARQGLSAQLVWTLRQLGSTFTGLRLLSNGVPFDVPSEGEVQAAGDWNTYDPEGLGRNPPYFYVASRRLRSSSPLPPGPATSGSPGRGGAFAVDAVAVTPDRSRLALFEGAAPGRVTVHLGAPDGTGYTTGVTAPGLASPSWGSGQDGLWALQQGRSVVLLTDGLRKLVPVTVPGLPAGPLQSLAVSRDGVRVALVVAGRLYTGRVDRTPAGPQVDGLAEVQPGLRDVTRVAWSSSTGLVVLGALTRPRQVLRMSADGSSTTVVNSSGLVPLTVAAAGSALVVGTKDGLYTASGSGFTAGVAGGAPVFPG